MSASFATQYAQNIVEFTTPAVSSSTLGDILGATAVADPYFAPFASQLLPMLDQLLVAANPQIRYAQASRNGYTVVEAGPDGVSARFVELLAAAARTRL